MKETNPRAIRLIRCVTAVLVGATVVAALSVLSPNVVQAVTGAASSGHAAAADSEDALKGSVWVVNRDRGELTIFDADTGRVVKTLLVGAGAHDICISDRARKAYITAESINAVITVDTETLEIDSIPVGPLPHHIEPSHDGRTIFVTLASHTPAVGAPAYAAIDTETNSVTFTTTSTNPAARSHAVFPTPDGDRVFVAHDTGDAVTGIDVGSGDIFLSVAPIPRAEEVVATRFGDQLWVSSRGDGTVKRIDIATAAVIDSVPVGVQPESVMLTPNERTLVASLRGTPAALAFVDVDAVTPGLIGTVQIGGPGTFGDLAVMSRDGHYVYATFDATAAGTGGVAVVDVRTRTVVATWPYPATGRPHGIRYSRKKVRF